MVPFVYNRTVFNQHQTNVNADTLPEANTESVPENKIVMEPEEKLRPDDLLNAGPMAGSLQGMQTSLAKVIGPIAKVVFIEALEQWIDTDKPGFSTLSNLVKILRKEINDPEKFNAYQKRIMQYIWVDN